MDHINPVAVIFKILFWCTIGLIIWIAVKVIEKLSSNQA